MRSDQFKCSICNEVHKIETLIELPEPLIYTKEEKEAGLVKYLTKNSFVIGRELAVIKALISIKILDDIDGDTLDIYSWILIDGKEILRAKTKHENQENAVLQGRIDKTLPVFQNKETILVKINFANNLGDDLLITEIVSEGRLKNAFDNGITTNKLINIIEKTLHFK